MTRLKDLYRVKRFLLKEGFSVSDDFESKIDELEEKIIKNDILPKVGQLIEPYLQTLDRELLFFVKYTPGKPLNINMLSGKYKDIESGIISNNKLLYDRVELVNINSSQKKSWFSYFFNKLLLK